MKTTTPSRSFLSPHPSRFVLPVTSLLLALLMLTGCGGSEATPQEPQQDASREQQSTSPDESGHSEEEPHAARAVALQPEQMQSLGIQIDTLERGSATSTLSRPASVQFDPDRTAKVGPRIEAKVVRVVKDLGERVAAGEAIAVMSSVDLGKAKAQYLTARARLKTHHRAYEREQGLYADSISSEATLLEAEAQFEEARAELRAARETLRLYGLTETDVETAGESSTPLSYFRVTSPISGVLQQRDAAPGETIGSQETPFHVANPSQMWVMIAAYERDVPVVRPGQRVALSVRSLPETSFEGRVDFVAQMLDPETRTLRVRAVVLNADGLLRDGMYGQARIYTDAQVERALVPTDAVQTIGGESFVFVPGGENGHFRAVPVRTGDESQNGMVELVAGLRPGDVAVTRGAFDLKAALTSSTRSASHGH